jgi:kinase
LKNSYPPYVYGAGVSDFEPLSWKIRMKIALDVAKGLAFLHSDEVIVIHGNLKTSKILIDSVSELH